MVDLPDGIPAPKNGNLPYPDASQGFAAYIHVPFCRVRCGYCDFNTYTNFSLGKGATPSTYGDSLEREIELSRRVLMPGSVTSVFFGGGTPTVLGAEDLAKILRRLDDTFGIRAGAEITTEANPETVSRDYLRALQDSGFNRISFGMQSAVPHVLRMLDRRHTPGQVERVAQWAHELGLEFSLDIIYGAPNESVADWELSVKTAIALEPNHISAYGLTIEDGTKMGQLLAHGEIVEQDDAIVAAKYEIADDLLFDSGYQWYEISNWAKPGYESQHNIAYWTGANWWGYGPGAHSHINGVRFWNVKHPRAYAQRLMRKGGYNSPVAAREILTPEERREEQIMLGLRLAHGIEKPEDTSAETIARLIGRGLIDGEHIMKNNRIVLTRQGRLLADMVTRELW